MKARNLALIGLGVLAVGGGALYFLKSKGIISDNVNSGGVTFFTAEEAEQKLDDRIAAMKRLGIEPTIEVNKDSPEVRAQKLAAFKAKYESGDYGPLTGIENLIL